MLKIDRISLLIDSADGKISVKINFNLLQTTDQASPIDRY